MTFSHVTQDNRAGVRRMDDIVLSLVREENDEVAESLHANEK